ncbi:Nucleobindin-1 isoform 3 [Schistosoma japonicum]|uniref:Nucleobindin-1 isoform 3 n=2 Tax=Schistosoma japonicum TaxID=6182 RepID=A0A4Z2DG36_SCHJA|nr:Nucleobindin-1 isoform 3 [Schistosoma japonicum]
MISVFLFVLTFQYIISVPVIPNYEMPEEAAQYEKYLEEAPKALNVDDHILASAKRLIKENSTLDDLLLLWNTSIRDRDSEKKRHIIEELLKIRLKSNLGHTPDVFGGSVLKDETKPRKESLKKIVDRLKKLDSEQETKYQKHVEEEKNNTVRRFLKHSDEERAAMLRHFKESAERHRRRPKIYQPGSEDQLKEYWEKYEGLDRESFNPRTLFADIDLDGDGYLNVNEIEAFLQREIEKVYNPEDPDFDPWEEKYDQIKMRQKFMERFDTDKDYFISREEFLKNVKVPYVLGDHYWKTAQDVEDMFETDESELRRLASEAQSLEKDHLTDAPNLHQTTEQPNVQKT